MVPKIKIDNIIIIHKLTNKFNLKTNEENNLDIRLAIAVPYSTLQCV